MDVIPSGAPTQSGHSRGTCFYACSLLALAAMALTASSLRSAEPTTEDPPNPEGLALKLNTDKQVYNPGEQIRIEVVLVNNGEKGVYLTPVIDFHFHMMDEWQTNKLSIEIEDPLGSPVRRQNGLIACGLFVVKKKPFYKFIQETRALVSPGESREYSWTLRELDFKLSKPGRYRLRAKYLEPSYQKLVAEEQFLEAWERLNGAWWANLESEWVEIEILP